MRGEGIIFYMFDGLDIGSLCYAPFVALFVGVTVYSLGTFSIARIKNKDVSRSIWLKRLITIASIVIVPMACISSVALGIGSAVPSPWIKPSTRNISSEWVFTQCTVERFGKRWDNISGNQGYIKFNFDKTVEIQNLPVLWALSDQKHKDDGHYISGMGSWHVDEISGRIGGREWLLVAQLKEINGEEENQVLGFYFDGHLPPYVLAYEGNINLVKLTKKGVAQSYWLCLPWE